MFDRLKSLPLTIVLTVLIWMYAESQVRLETDQVEHVIKSIQFRPSPGAAVVERFTLNPQHVTVLISSHTLQDIGGSGKLTVVAVPEVDLATLPSGTDQTVPVRYTAEYSGAGDNEQIEIVPTEGTVNLHIGKKE